MSNVGFHESFVSSVFSALDIWLLTGDVCDLRLMHVWYL